MKDGTIQLEALDNANIFRKVYSALAGALQERDPTNLPAKQQNI